MGKETECHFVRGGACRWQCVKDSCTPAFKVLEGVVDGLNVVLKCGAVTGKTPGYLEGPSLQE